MAVRGDENVRERDIQFQDGEQESVAIVNREDPSVSKTINVCEARTGEKLDSEEMWKRKAKEVQEIRSPGKQVWSKWVETRKSCLVSAPREGSTQSKSRTKCTKKCGCRVATLDLIRVSVSCSAFIWQVQVSRI